MNTHLDDIVTIEFVPTPLSLRADQREWLDAEALRQMHRNRSRLVQEAIDIYRLIQTGEKRLVDPEAQNGAAS